MKLSKTYIEKKAILIDESELLQLKKFLDKNYSRIKYSARCIDDTNIDFKNFEDLIEYENPDFRKITSLNIYADNEEENEKFDTLIRISAEFQIEIGSRYSSQTLEYRLNSNDYTKANHFESELKERLKRIRPWYWFISKTSFGVIVVILSIGLLIFNGLRLAYYRSQGVKIVESTESSITISERVTFMILWIIFVVGIIIGLDKLKDYLFPKVIIKLGQQKNKSIKGNRLIYFVFAVFILSIIINLISNWIWAQVS
jgi:hypothetical protein